MTVKYNKVKVIQITNAITSYHAGFIEVSQHDKLLYFPTRCLVCKQQTMPSWSDPISMIKFLLEKCHFLQSTQQTICIFVGTKSHVGIRGNERDDDAAAKAALWFQLLQLFSAHGLVQHVDQPTHSQSGIIYAVIAREDSSLHTITVRDVGLSDHFINTWTLKMSRPK